MELLSAGLQYGTCWAARRGVLYLGVFMGFFHAAWVCPCWVFPHWLDSAQHPIPQGDGAYEFIIIIITVLDSIQEILQ